MSSTHVTRRNGFTVCRLFLVWSSGQLARSGMDNEEKRRNVYFRGSAWLFVIRIRIRFVVHLDVIRNRQPLLLRFHALVFRSSVLEPHLHLQGQKGVDGLNFTWDVCSKKSDVTEDCDWSVAPNWSKWQRGFRYTKIIFSANSDSNSCLVVKSFWMSWSRQSFC